MKKYLVFFRFAPIVLISIFIVNSCKSQSAPKVQEASSANLQYLAINYPVLFKLTRKNGILCTQLNTYAQQIENASQQITSEAKLMNFMKTRDSLLIPQLTNHLNTAFENQKATDFQLYASNLEQELLKMGMTCTPNADQVFTEIKPATFIPTIAQKYGKPDWWLFTNYSYAQTQTFFNPMPNSLLNTKYLQKMIQYGNQLQTQFPQSKYTNHPAFKTSFEAISHLFFDIHKATTKTNNTATTAWYALEFNNLQNTQIDSTYLQNFVNQNSTSKYAAIAKKILANPSEITYQQSPTPTTIFAVVTNQYTDFAEEEACHAKARTQIFKYLNQKIDVPHLITYEKNNQDVCAVAYRFFSTKNKAQNALNIIKKQLPKAQIVELNYNYKTMKMNAK